MASKPLEGLVRKGIGGFYTVETPEGFFTCTARGRFRKARISPYAGDRVRILGEEDGTGALEEILPRRKFFSAAYPLANLDQLFIVSSLRDPYPEPLIIDENHRCGGAGGNSACAGAHQNGFGGCFFLEGDLRSGRRALPCRFLCNRRGSGPGAETAGRKGICLYGKFRCGKIHAAECAVPPSWS
mgnify:CR=1 FL=1